MLIIPLALLVLLLLLIAGIWLTVSLLGLIVTLLVAFGVGWLADKIMPGRIPYGWLGATIAGLLGSWIGGIILGDAGPTIGGISIFPALVGAVILAFVIDWLGKKQAPPDARG